MMVKELEQVVVRFSGDLAMRRRPAGQHLSTARLPGNDISTFPDHPADIRALAHLPVFPVFRCHIGAEKVYTPGDK